MKSTDRLGVPLVLVVGGVFLACSSYDTNLTDPEDQVTSLALRVEVSESASAGNSIGPAFARSVVFDDGSGNQLNISEASIGLTHIEFRRAGQQGCINSDAESQPDGDDCAEVAVEPTILELPVTAGPSTTPPVSVTPGTYIGMEFDLYQVTQADEDIVNREPALLGASVVVRGSFDDGSGAAVLDSAVFTPTGPVQLEFPSSLELPEGGVDTVTLSVDVGSWFREDGTLVDPDVAARDPTLSARVAERILGAFSARSSR